MKVHLISISFSSKSVGPKKKLVEMLTYSLSLRNVDKTIYALQCHLIRGAVLGSEPSIFDLSLDGLSESNCVKTSKWYFLQN